MVCDYCREVIPVAAGFLVSHGFVAHGKRQLCAGSGTPVCSSCS